MDIERLKELRESLNAENWNAKTKIEVIALTDDLIARQSVKSEDVQEPTIRKDRTVEEDVEAIDQYQPWVSAEVEKPKVGRPVLVTYIGHNDGKPYSDGVATWRFEENGDKGGWFWEIDGCKVAVEITHWKPLPEPPKGE